MNKIFGWTAATGFAALAALLMSGVVSTAQAPTPSPAARAAEPPPPGAIPFDLPAGLPIERIFEALDADHDGIVTLAEALKTADDLFDAMDQSKDGIIDKSELESWFGRANPEGARVFVLLHDIDGDGKISKAEFESPGKKRFALFDRNDDGKVTPEELNFARMTLGAGAPPPMPPPPDMRPMPPMDGPSGMPGPGPHYGGQPMPPQMAPRMQQQMPGGPGSWQPPQAWGQGGPGPRGPGGPGSPGGPGPRADLPPGWQGGPRGGDVPPGWQGGPRNPLYPPQGVGR